MLDRPRNRPMLAFDRQPLRSYDLDGRLRVARANLSRASVDGYLGREIPEADRLGLDPDGVYKLWRHPAELAKAASTFAQVPLLRRHVAVTATDHRPDDVVGAVGDSVDFDGTYLYAPLIVWAQDAIDDIEDGSKKQLSCGYRYRHDMTPGRTPAGEAYDGVMRDLVGQHVALVDVGRAGPSCCVGDAKLKARWSFDAMFPNMNRLQG